MKQALATMRILWGALLMSTVMLLVVMFVVRSQWTTAPMPQLSLLPALAMAGIGTALASLIIPERLQRQAALQMRPELTTEVDDRPNAPMFYRDQPTRQVFAEPQKIERSAIGIGQTTLILGMALGELTALFGFVLGYLGFDIVVVVPFFVACWLLQLRRFPTPQKIVAPIEKAHSAVMPKGYSYE